ncbi:N-acetylglucosamine kinase [Phaeacidiphilus oryzae]|uniref:N-acetylglucosamine kinase n=1 Tax=Phaeacidiphilus oryzae TaxID=348818 RepID=UPI0006903823|nr:BadF/BadG/BcrA/BcrD ATPase family protein [Phaeacidiphilus oryzae]
MQRAAEAVGAVLARLDPPVVGGLSIGALAVGAAGAGAAPEGAERLAALLAERHHCPALVTSDLVTAHAGALAGGPGVVLIAGTGAVAAGLDEGGELRRADGWGIWLGDDGSGRWIGQRGLTAALRAWDGRGPATALLDAARALADPLTRLPAVVGGDPAPERRLASFAPAVLAAARDGDAVARRIAAEALDRLVETACAVATGGAPVAVVGGLTGDAAFAKALHEALSTAGLRPAAPLGDALDGAALLTARADLPHEKQVFRVRPPRH